VTGRTLLHLQCHFGVDTLSWARLGARVTGVDFSERSIEAARRLARDTGLGARFICANVLDLPASLDGEFDVVYTSRGVLCWLPDLAHWAQVVAHFLRPGGTFYVTEAHPCAMVWDDDPGVTDLRLRYPYFESSEPLAFPVVGSYADPHARVVQETSYEWVHSLGEIVTAVARVGLRIETLREFPFLEWEMPYLARRDDGTWGLPPGTPGELPLSFSLKARKPV
jgi:SAM-dependent methyltransferase